jgi:uncharacterized membrane protein
MNTDLVVTNFTSEGAAGTAYSALRRLEREHSLTILDAATLVKHDNGTSEIHDSQDVDAQHGAYFGVISGALIGLIGGPVGVVVGSVAGAAAGAAAAQLIDLGFQKQDLQALNAQLAPGSSTLVVLVEATGREQLDTALASFDGQSTQHSLHSGRTERMAVPAFGPLVVVEPRMEDEHAWTKLIAALEANIAHLDAQIAKESQHIRAELATLRDQRDVKRQELDVQIQARIDSLNTTIANGRAALADGTDEAKAQATAEIVILENKRHAAWHQLEASWHAQQAEWHRDLTAMRDWATKATADAKASVDAQIAALEAKRMARQQEWEERTHMASDAAQDLKTGADAARADLRQASKQAADEFK